MKTISVKHGNNEITLTKEKNIELIVSGTDTRIYRANFYELEDYTGKHTMQVFYQSPPLYVGWTCQDAYNLKSEYPNKIFINIRGEMGWFADIIYDKKHDEFYRINEVRNIETLEKVCPPILITGAVGGGTSYIVKILKYCGLYFGTDSGEKASRKTHESVVFDTMREMLSFDKGKYIGWYDIEGVDEIKELVKKKLDFYSILFRNQLEYRFSHFWGDAPIDSLWAWKQPSISLILPLWKNVFPKSRLIIIKRNRKKISESIFDQQGDWFRDEANSKLIKYYFEPDISGFSEDDIFYCDFNKVVKSVHKMNEMLKWIGLKTLKTRAQHETLLKMTGYEGRVK